MWIKKVLFWLSLALAISLSQWTRACWEFALEPIKLPFILSGVCSPSEANYCSNPFEVLITICDDKILPEKRGVFDNIDVIYLTPHSIQYVIWQARYIFNMSEQRRSRVHAQFCTLYVCVWLYDIHLVKKAAACFLHVSKEWPKSSGLLDF